MKWILILASAIGLLVGLPVSGMAADIGGGYVTEEIVVFGRRLSQQRSLDAKQDSETILDAIVADDIGRLPDKNAAEVVDRLPGVSITIDQGEGRYVSIRGITPTLNEITINGVNAGSPEADNGGRLAPLDVIGGNLLQSLELVKMRTPDRDGQGIGGTINVVTRSAFDYPEGQVLIGNVRVGMQDRGDETPWSLDLTGGYRNDDDSFGMVVGGSYEERKFESAGVYQDDWREVTVAGTTASIPENAKNNFYTLERERTALSAMADFKPDDAHHLFARTYYSNFQEDEERQRYEHFFSRTVTTLNPDGSGSSGDDNRREQDLRLETKEKEFFNVAVGGEHQLAEALRADWVFQVNSNQQREPNRNWEYRGGGYGPDTWTIDGDGLIQITPGSVDLLDPSLLEFRRIRLQDNRTDEDARIGGLDLTLDTDWMAGGYLKFGGKVAHTDRANDGSNVRYNLGGTDWFLSDFGQFGGTFTNDVDGSDYPNMIVDPDASNAFFDANRENAVYFERDEADTFDSEYQNDYDVKENIYAGYAMISQDFTESFNLIAGLRYEGTEVDSRAFTRDEDNLTVTPVRGEGDYDNWLPSLIATFRTDNGWVVRGGYNRSLGRPDYNQIAPISVLSRDGSDAELFIGNPELEARVSDSFDVSVEWYFSELSVLSIAGFYKDMADFIVSRTENFPDYDYNGETFENFDLVTLENASDAELTGVELRFDHQFDNLHGFLGGLGFQISLAWIDSELDVQGRDDDLPLVGQPDWTRTYALTYQNKRFDAFLTYNQTSEYLSSIEGSPATDLYIDDYERMDLKASYGLTERMRLFLEWQNILDGPTREYQQHPDQNTQWEEYGWTLYFGANVTL